jgi:hypothetical protein
MAMLFFIILLKKKRPLTFFSENIYSRKVQNR